jgi:hypothetical protein
MMSPFVSFQVCHPTNCKELITIKGGKGGIATVTIGKGK